MLSVDFLDLQITHFWGFRLLRGRIVYENEKNEKNEVPLVGLAAVEVVDPVADAVLLVEGRAVAAHVRNAPAVLVAHVEQHALELLVGVEAHGAVRTVKRQRHVGKLLPPLRLLSKRWPKKNGKFMSIASRLAIFP